LTSPFIELFFGLHITITEFVSDVPSHGLNDKRMVEMGAFKERGLLTRELDHADDYL